MRVLVLRTGGVWWGKGQKVGALQSQGNHQAIAEVLAERFDVLCGGHIIGDTGLDQFSWGVIKPESPVCKWWVDEVAAWSPDVVVDIVGSSVSVSDPFNARGIRPAITGVRYCWPMHELLKTTGIPRICCVTDMRCYPIDQEINIGSRPVALLSQEDKSWNMRILDRRYRVQAKYAALETLRWKYLEPMCNSGEWKFTLLGHAHLKDVRIKKRRDEVYAWALPEPADWWRILGAGWEGWPNWHGVTDNVQKSFSESRTAALFPMAHGWVSPKFGECVYAGCTPLLYGRGDAYLTYDAQQHHVPLDSEFRFSSRDELLDKIENPPMWMQPLSPDPSLLCEAVEAIGNGVVDYGKYGGFEPLETV